MLGKPKDSPISLKVPKTDGGNGFGVLVPWRRLLADGREGAKVLEVPRTGGGNGFGVLVPWGDSWQMGEKKPGCWKKCAARVSHAA